MHTSSDERFRRLTDTQRLHVGLAARSARAGAITAAFSFTDFAVRIGSTAVLARLLAPAEFGLIMMVTAVTGIADQLRDLGLSFATIQRKEITHPEVTNLFWLNVGFGTLLAGIVCGLSPVISGYYHEPRLSVIACVLSTTLLFGGLTVQHEALLTRTLHVGQVAGIRLAANIISTALAIVLAFTGWGYWALVWREISRSVLVCIAVWILMRWRPGLPDRRTSIRSLLHLGANISVANLAASFVAGADRFLLGRFWGPEAVAIYRQAYQLVTAPTDQLTSPVYQVTQPCLSMLQDDGRRYNRFYCRIVGLVSLVTMPISVFTAIYAPEITLLLLGDKWRASAPILALLSLGTFIRQINSATTLVPATHGRGSTYLYLSLLQNAALVLLMAAGVRWGAAGIAIGYVASLYTVFVPRMYYSFRGSPVTMTSFLAATGRPMLASMVMALFLALLRLNVPVGSLLMRLGLGAGAAALVFPAAWLALPGGVAELRALLSVLRLGFTRRGLDVHPVAVTAN